MTFARNMKKRVSQVLSLILLVATVASCKRQKDEAELCIQVGDRVLALAHHDSVSTLRSEILEHVETNLNEHGGTETDWVRVYSRFTSGEEDAEETNSKSLISISERSTPKFRLREEEDGMFIVEILNEDMTIKTHGRSNSSEWSTLQVILKTTLNDSILNSIIKNKSEQSAAGNPLPAE